MTQHPLIDALIPMNLFADIAPVNVDLVYANPVHARNIFSLRLYHPNAQLWLHEDLARITLLAAYRVNRLYGWTLELKDGLRTTEAQAMMLETDIVKSNPHWTREGIKRLVSPPGAGAHPRGMAIDVCALDPDGHEIDMGTAFDHLTHDPADNPAARDYTNLPEVVLEHRTRLEEAFTHSAAQLNLPIVPLASEWWDYRFPADLYGQYEALSDTTLPDYMKMTGRPAEPVMPDIMQAIFVKRTEDLLNELTPLITAAPSHENLQDA
jgi:D-alanyl-D-alanine dipeptidase